MSAYESSKVDMQNFINGVYILIRKNVYVTGGRPALE